MLLFVCLVIWGICDLFDGTVARTKKNRTADEKSFGIQLDSLCDTVCFGVFPAIYLYLKGVDSVFGIIALIFFVLCAVCRLAFFNVLEANRQKTEGGSASSFRGMPVTTTSILFPIVYLLSLVIPKSVMLVVYYALPIICGFLFILDVKFPKLDVSKFIKKKAQ
jgi:CDP-diacylglycerol--serine O-phosphatidyltransferase